MKEIEREIERLIEDIVKLSKEYYKIDKKFGASEDYIGNGEFLLSLTETNCVETSLEETENGLELVPLEDLGLKPYVETSNITIKDEHSSWYYYILSIKNLIEENLNVLENSVERLTNLLDDKEQKLYREKLSAIRIEKIQKKQYITVKDFTEIFDKSNEWQRNRRKRLHDRLPFIQEGKRTNILYEMEEVKLWFKRNI